MPKNGIANSNQNGSGERALVFETQSALADAVDYLWRRYPFDLGGGTCLIVPPDVAKDLLSRFGARVREIRFVDLADLPHDEAIALHKERFRRSSPPCQADRRGRT
jgi:hypothetical protein